MNSPERTLNELLAVGRFLKGFPGMWWIGGGWAIDSWLGKASRGHEDIEICILRRDQDAAYNYCSDWDFYTPVNNEWSPMSESERLNVTDSMLQLRRSSIALAADERMPPEFEFILNEADNGDWIFKLEPSIRLPLTEAYCMSPLGLPVTVPEIVLLHKAWYPSRPKDEHDFANVLSHLSLKQRTWLYQNLAFIRPNHPWLQQLEP
jgi:hypothetical protein